MDELGIHSGLAPYEPVREVQQLAQLVKGDPIRKLAAGPNRKRDWLLAMHSCKWSFAKNSHILESICIFLSITDPQKVMYLRHTVCISRQCTGISH